ncbi:AAA family ATPase [Gordonia shandongensis]|uniref:AAA family ATPase n=1 Tax=Gordonia shandongensis TaxID=376351 RepID=UPI00041FF000|nr:AAA family ATPase [Gordonia shandongensis]
MRLHRLGVRDFRGITDREVEFADRGVTVIEGENEAGKSSMVEAFDLLLSVRADSKAKQVRAVQPAGRDVGTRVWAEISCGPWRFEYGKCFNRSPETTLTITEPVAEQLTGRAAHERVEAILAQSLDRTLFTALRLLQSGDPVLGDLTDSAALSRALDRVAGETESDGGETPETQNLVAAVAAEYDRYFTRAHGKPARELAQAIAAARQTREAVAERQAILDTVADAADRLPRVVETVRQLIDTERTGQVELATAGAALAEAESIGEQATAAAAVVESKQLAASAAREAVAARGRRRERLDRLRAEVAENADQIREATSAAERATAAAAELDSRLAEARTRWDAMRAEVAAAEAEAAVAADREQCARLEGVLTEVDRLGAERATAREVVERSRVDDQDVRAAADLSKSITTASARVEAAAAIVSVTRLGDGEVVVDGESVVDSAEVAASQRTVVEVPGAVRVEVAPGGDSADLADRLAALRGRAEALADRCGVESIDEIAAVAQRRAEAATRAADLDRAIARELAGATRADVAARRDEIAARLPEGGAAKDQAAAPAVDLAAMRAAEREAADAVTRVERDREAQLAAAREQTARAGTLEAAGHRTAEEAANLEADLVEETAVTTDEALVARVDRCDAALAAAQETLTTVRARLQGIDPARLRADVDQCEAAQQRVRDQLAAAKTERTELATRLEICRTDGRLDELSDAVAADDAAQAQLRRVSERAAGARLLHETLQRKRNESRAQHVGPFARRLEELAAPVFGTGVRFRVADDFTIATRTLDGVTVDVEALSGGAREQLGLLARLACATLVDAADGAPVILDDALGYTDPQRLASMARVLGDSGAQAQIIILTCTPDRYRDVEGARLIAV